MSQPGPEPQPPPAEQQPPFYQQGEPYDAHVSSGSSGSGSQPPPPAGSAVIQVGPIPPASAPFAPAVGVAPPAAAVGGGVAAPLPLLPPGATLYNGGILYSSSSLFSNAYRVPGPHGRGWVYFDRSMPMPPPPATLPSLWQQWQSLTGWIQLFFILLIVYWIVQWNLHLEVALVLPLLFLPTYLLYRQWRKHYRSAELLLVARFYVLGFVPGALVVMAIEGVITVVFMLLCFQDVIGKFMEKGPGSTTTPGEGGGGGGGSAPEGMEFLNLPPTPGLFIFLFLLSYVSAGVVEEGLKYYAANRIKRERPAYRVAQGFLLYSLAAALGFSTVENIGYVLSGALTPGGDGSFLGVLFNAMGRVFISTPLHLLTAYLLALQVIRRDVLGERLNIFQIMGWSVFFHGTFDFGLFLIMSLQRYWTSPGQGEENAVSIVLMACVVVLCYAGMAYRIWMGRQYVFQRVEVPAEEQEEDRSGGGAAAVAADGGSHEVVDGAVPAPPPSRNGFSRLHNSDPSEAQARAIENVV